MKYATNAIVKDVFKVANTNDYLVELSLDNGGLPSSNMLVDIEKRHEFEVKYRVLYAAMKDVHKRFKFEKIKTIALKIEESDLAKLKVELLEKENNNYFQFIISPTKTDKEPFINQEFICIQKK